MSNTYNCCQFFCVHSLCLIGAKFQTYGSILERAKKEQDQGPTCINRTVLVDQQSASQSAQSSEILQQLIKGYIFGDI